MTRALSTVGQDQKRARFLPPALALHNFIHFLQNCSMGAAFPLSRANLSTPTAPLRPKSLSISHGRRLGGSGRPGREGCAE
jgi:hypothetical protein